jgi:hypothetical protein
MSQVTELAGGQLTVDRNHHGGVDRSRSDAGGDHGQVAE